MMKYTIPTFLALTIIVAGIFAFMPIDEARTVHTTIQASTVQISVTDSTTTNGVDEDILITCPTTSDGCQILEVYVEETASQNVIFDAIDATINGDAIADMVDINPDNTINGARELIGQAGGIAFGPGDIISLETTGATSDTAVYTVRVIGLIEGDTADFEIAFN